MLKKAFMIILGILTTWIILLVVTAAFTKEKETDENQIQTDTKPIYNHFPDLPVTENIMWCSQTSDGIGLTTVRIYMFAFYDYDVSVRFSEKGSLNEAPNFYFLPEKPDDDNEKWRKLEDMKFAFQSGIKDSEKMVTSVYLNEAGNIIYMEGMLLFSSDVLLVNGDSETRTRDLYVANVSLSQLSYIPVRTIIPLP